jgi:hypothetical protein
MIGGSDGGKSDGGKKSAQTMNFIMQLFVSFLFLLISSLGLLITGTKEFARAPGSGDVFLAQVSGGCTDSDYGRNHFVYGSVSAGGRAYLDSCYTTTYLYENYCESGYRKYEYVKCPKGCASGACIGSCYLDVVLNETASGDSSAFSLAQTPVAVTSENISHLVNTFYSEEPSPFRAEVQNAYKSPLGRYELWSGRYIIAETFGGSEPKGEIIELPSAALDLFLPLNRSGRYLSIYSGTSTVPLSTLTLDQSKLVCSVGQ